MKLLSTLLLVASATALAVPRKRYDYGTDMVKGVNLGGWFVLEPYITPSLFEAFGSDVPVDEYHFTQRLGKDNAKSVLEKHWAEWYNESDFKAIADAGLDTVRIPIGYWAFILLEGDPYVQGQQVYLDQAIEWARKYGLKVWVDLHGAPGSQNGFDNSGLRDQIEYQTDANVNATLTALQLIFNKYGADSYLDVVSGIEILNEPLGSLLDLTALTNFYNWAYGNMRSVSSNTFIIHDAFEAFGYWNDFGNNYDAVVVDHHHYQVFSAGELARDIDEHVSVACSWGSDVKVENKWNVAGEWSAALTDCALWLNGVGRGARWSGDYDGLPSYGLCEPYLSPSLWTLDYRVSVRKYIEAQLDAFEQTQGWIFWNWKCEDAIDWDMSRLIAEGVFPQPLSDRQYPNQCGF